jgi:hypothetical protein
MKLIDRCLAATTFRNVDPQRYVIASMRENADRAIRVALDDPRTGRKVRNIAKELGTRDPDEILSVYRERFPKERTGIKLVKRALTPSTQFKVVVLNEFDFIELDQRKADLYGNRIG